MHISVRPLKKEDIESISAYWLKSDPDFLKGMGVDLNALPPAEQFRSAINGQLLLPLSERQTYALIWELDSKAIGHCNVNPFEMEKWGCLHIHIWEKAYRRKGIGRIALRKSIDHFFEVLRLKELYAEPYAQNAAPNKTLPLLGFKEMRKYTTTPGSINFEQEVVRWELTVETWSKINR